MDSILITRTNVASVGSVFNDTRKVKVVSLPETIKEKSTFRPKALRRADEGPSLETSIFPLSFQVVRLPLPFAYSYNPCQFIINLLLIAIARVYSFCMSAMIKKYFYKAKCRVYQKLVTKRPPLAR